MSGKFNALHDVISQPEPVFKLIYPDSCDPRIPYGAGITSPNNFQASEAEIP